MNHARVKGVQAKSASEKSWPHFWVFVIPLLPRCSLRFPGGSDRISGSSHEWEERALCTHLCGTERSPGCESSVRGHLEKIWDHERLGLYRLFCMALHCNTLSWWCHPRLVSIVFWEDSLVWDSVSLFGWEGCLHDIYSCCIQKISIECIIVHSPDSSIESYPKYIDGDCAILSGLQWAPASYSSSRRMAQVRICYASWWSLRQGKRPAFTGIG